MNFPLFCPVGLESSQRVCRRNYGEIFQVPAFVLLAFGENPVMLRSSSHRAAAACLSRTPPTCYQPTNHMLVYSAPQMHRPIIGLFTQKSPLQLPSGKLLSGSVNRLLESLVNNPFTHTFMNQDHILQCVACIGIQQSLDDVRKCFM